MVLVSYPERVIQGVNCRLGKKKTNGLSDNNPLVFIFVCHRGTFIHKDAVRFCYYVPQL